MLDDDDDSIFDDSDMHVEKMDMGENIKHNTQGVARTTIFSLTLFLSLSRFLSLSMCL